MSNLDEKTLIELKDGLVKYVQVFNLTQSEGLLIQDVWEYIISQANMPDFDKKDGD